MSDNTFEYLQAHRIERSGKAGEINAAAWSTYFAALLIGALAFAVLGAGAVLFWIPSLIVHVCIVKETVNRFDLRSDCTDDRIAEKIVKAVGLWWTISLAATGLFFLWRLVA